MPLRGAAVMAKIGQLAQFCGAYFRTCSADLLLPGLPLVQMVGEGVAAEGVIGEGVAAPHYAVNGEQSRFGISTLPTYVLSVF